MLYFKLCQTVEPEEIKKYQVDELAGRPAPTNPRSVFSTS